MQSTRHGPPGPLSPAPTAPVPELTLLSTEQTPPCICTVDRSKKALLSEHPVMWLASSQEATCQAPRGAFL